MGAGDRDVTVDFLIVGAGLAGCILGYSLLRQNKSVLLLELRDAATKNKLCAGATPQGFAYSFDKLYGAGEFASLDPFPIEGWIGRCLDREAPMNPNSTGITAMPRKRLDDYCLRRYQEAGGMLRDRATPVSVDLDAGLVVCLDLRTRARFTVGFEHVVGADGAFSKLRRLLVGRRPRVIPALEGLVATSRHDMLFEYYPGVDGCCWYIPSGVNATVGCGFYNLEKPLVPEMRGYLAKFCGKLGLEVPALRGACLPRGNDILLCHKDRAWFVGDAAGLIDPMMGAGIHRALESSAALSQSFEGGHDYASALATSIEVQTSQSDALSGRYFSTCMSIGRRGHPCPVP